ncbi:hypothetical protein J7T55_004959 [Diaporthe amygdali]|uniref:uncharacterized protein n=1 Tax=Phomopsis amygdali TaxID=1214568 RepID=UPI0022FE60E3|nr:uncharacterized protein J7T55_004959 [Diaporthe amygdali]KAJ0114715.1 hypothetical protein J7T55_004959 [Diaporthe amygdali]
MEKNPCTPAEIRHTRKETLVPPSREERGAAVWVNTHVPAAAAGRWQEMDKWTNGQDMDMDRGRRND